MPDNQPADQGNVTFNYNLEQARANYGLINKPPEMSDIEWSIVTDEGFRKYVATQLGIEYVTRQELISRAGNAG